MGFLRPLPGPPSVRILAPALAVLLLWLACALPSLERSRLEDVDELTGARVAQAAALRGHWWPLTLGDRVFFEKPPLMLWLAGATARVSGHPFDAWPYRLWTCLGAGLCLFSLALIGGLMDRPWAGLIAALALALQGDFLFHSRYFTFDTLFLGFALAALASALWALRGPHPGRWWLAGLALALAVWFKSWFVLALLPAFALALASALPAGRRGSAALALAVPPLLALFLWAALYLRWNGAGFLAEEWSVNLAGRALGRTNFADPEGHGAYYLKWAARSAPALIPWVLAVPLGLARGVEAPSADGVSRARAFARAWTWALCLSWLLGLALVRAETINYILPLEAGLCLALGLEFGTASQRGQDRELLRACLLAAALLSAARLWDPAWSLALGLPLAFLWRAADRPVPGLLATRWTAASVWLGIVLIFVLSRPAQALLQRPLDPSRQVAELLQGHPAPAAGATLLVVGGPTQAVEFYAAGYQVRRLQFLPAVRPREATLVQTRQGWIFYPPLTVARHGSPPA